MKSKGIVREIDKLGRIVMPVEMRNSLGIENGNKCEFFLEGNKIIIKKFQNNCIFCGATSHITTFGEKAVCKSCIDKLKTID